MKEVKIIDTLDELLQYRGEWEKLIDINGLDIPFMEFEWIVPWWEILRENQELYIITFFKQDKVIGFCPLMKTKKGRYTEVEFLGSPQASYMDFLFDPSFREELNMSFLDKVDKIKDSYLFNLHAFATRSENFHILQKYLSDKGKTFYSRVIDCPYIDTRGKSFEEYYKAKRKHSSIKRIKSVEKKIADAGGELKYLNSSNLKENKDFMDKVFQIHDKRWSKKLDTSDFSSEKNKKFFTALATNNNKRLKVAVDFLTLNDEVIAFEYGIITGKTYLGYRACHDDDYSPLSPGKISLKENIKVIFDSDLEEFNFGTGYERYKLEWTDNRGGLNKLLFSTDDSYSLKILSTSMKKEELIKKLKSKPKIVSFKRNTLGKIKYILSFAYIRTRIKDARGRLTLYSLKQLIKKTCYRIIEARYFQVDIFKMKKPKGLNYKYDESYSATIASFNDVYTIAEFLKCSVKKVVSYMYKGNSCAIVWHKEKIVGCIWFSYSCENKRLKRQIDIIGRKILFIKKIFADRKYHVKDIQYVGLTHIHQQISKKEIFIGVRHRCIHNPNVTLKEMLIPQYCIRIKKVLKEEKVTLGEV